jgi:hypothetical protein
MARIPDPTPGLVFRYDYLRLHQFDEGIEHGKERPACILATLAEGEVLTGVRIIDEQSRTTIEYVARTNDVVIIPIQTDPPGRDQLGVVLDIETKRYIGLSTDHVSYAIVSEVNIDTWPSAGIQNVPGRSGQWAYPRLMPGPKMAAIARRFLQLRERNLVKALVRHP